MSTSASTCTRASATANSPGTTPCGRAHDSLGHSSELQAKSRKVDGAVEAVAFIKALGKKRHMSDINAAADEDLPFSRVFDFSGHVVLVTGASGGIGRSTAELFRERGAKLALVDKSPKVISVAEEIGGGAGAGEADITDE